MSLFTIGFLLMCGTLFFQIKAATETKSGKTLPILWSVIAVGFALFAMDIYYADIWYAAYFGISSLIMFISAGIVWQNRKQ